MTAKRRSEHNRRYSRASVLAKRGKKACLRGVLTDRAYGVGALNGRAEVIQDRLDCPELAVTSGRKTVEARVICEELQHTDRRRSYTHRIASCAFLVI